MKKVLIQNALAFTAALSFAAFAYSPAQAQNTSFTYQGFLDNAGAPASGLHDFRFRLFSVVSGGTQIGSTLCADNLNVVEGVFTAQIDFGQQFATTAQRYLEIDVRKDTGLTCGNAAGFVLMSPRQQLTATPMASHAKSAFALDAADGSPTNAVLVDDSGNVGIGTATPTTKLDVRGGPMLVENLGDQADLLWLASERSWVFRQEGTGAGTALKLQSIGGGGNKHFIVQTDGLMGVGTAAPTAKLDVRGDIRFGPSGEFQATAGVENLRLVRGEVDGNGTLRAGTGFTVQRDGEGLYAVTFNPPFSGYPTLVPYANRPPVGNQARWPVIYSLTASRAEVMIQFANGETTDSDWSFCVMGPK